jgi:hypothetical protein
MWLATAEAGSGAGAWFSRPLDYWGGAPYGAPLAEPSSAPAPTGEAPSAPEEAAAFDWADYADPRTEQFWKDGDHVPPAPLLEVIRSPTPENVARYRAWTSQQLEVAAWVSELLAAPDAAPPVSWSGVQVVYFYASACGYCRKNTPEVLELMTLGADVMPVHLDRPSPAYPSSTLWSAEMGSLVEVEGTPTWVLVAEGKRRVVRGYATVERLEKELRALLGGEGT